MKIEYRVLVCGGRNYGWSENSNRQKVMDKNKIMELVNTLNKIKDSIETLNMTMVVIQGEAKGADEWAKKWANANGVSTIDFTPDWDTHGKKAGFIRNSDMLKQGKPNLVVAFSGGNGTKMMCEIAEKANVSVKRMW